MGESFVQVAPDGSGKRLRTFERDMGGGVLAHDQFVLQAGYPTYYFQSAARTNTTITTLTNPGTLLWDLFNPAGSGLDVMVKKLFIQHSLAPVAGGGQVYNIHRTTTVGTGGTAIAAVRADTSDAALASVTSRSIPTGGASADDLFTQLPLSSEETSFGAMSWPFNVLAEGNETKDVHCNPGEGISVRIAQSTAAVGTVSVLVVVAVR